MDREIYILDGEKHNNFDELKEQLMNLFDYEGFDISNGAALRDSFPYYSMITLVWNDYDLSISKCGDAALDLISIFKEIECQNTGFHLFTHKSSDITVSTSSSVRIYSIDAKSINIEDDIADQIKEIFDLSFFLKVSPKDIIDLAQKYTKGFLVIELLNADELSQDLDDYISALESLNNKETNVRFTKVSF